MDEQLFKFESTESQVWKKRAVLGNGYFGIDLSNNYGQGFGVADNPDPFPVTYLGGVYSYGLEKKKAMTKDVIYRPFNAYTFIPAKQDPADNKNSLQKFTQTLDMKQATLTTLGRWFNFDTKTEVILCRNFPHFGMMKIEFKPDQLESFDFKYLLRKDPRTRYHKVTQSFLDGIQILKTEIEEDGYVFEKKEFYEIIQTSFVKLTDTLGNDIPFSESWEILHEGEIDFEGNLTYVEKIHVSQEELEKNHVDTLIFYLYFGIFKPTEVEGDLEAWAIENTKDIINRNYLDVKIAHTESWQSEIWESLIEISEPEIQKQIIASMYHLGCSFKAGYNNSAGPNGLNGYGWAGHVFWDSDLWMNLGLLLWAPELSRCITEFRKDRIQGALQNRREYIEEYLNGKKSIITEGIKFPWQSTTSGLETSPKGWASQEHISCIVIYGQWLYYMASKDEEYLRKVAYPITEETLKYLAQRVTKKKDGKYHFEGVIPADEYPHPHLVKDNAYTNLFVEKCMDIGITWANYLARDYPPIWKEIRDNMFYNFNKKKQRVIEFTHYRGQKIKQADTNLLTFPLEYPFSDEIKRNNMLYYFKKLPKNKIMMGSAIFSTIACELGMLEKAWEYFQDLFQHYHTDQFYIASESPTNSCWPFLTGLGGYLSNLYFGFGGIRIRENGLLFAPILPEELNSITFNKIRYQNTQIKYDIEAGGSKFSLTNLGNSTKFHISFRNNRTFEPMEKKMHPVENYTQKDEKTYEIEFKAGETIRFERKTSA